MEIDSVPILGLAAAIAWISLVTVEFYERHYRARIEANHENLRRLGKDRREELARQIAGENALDREELESRLNYITKVENAEDILTRDRSRVFYLLVALVFVTMGASYAPSFEILEMSMPVTWPTETVVYKSPLTLIAVDYASLVIVFLAGYLFLRRMFWFDRQILRISRATPVKVEVSHLTNHLAKLQRLADDFHDLVLKSLPQNEDTRIHRVLDYVSSHAKTAGAGVTVPEEQIHLSKRLVQNSLGLVDGWFDDYSKRLNFFAQNPGLLDNRSLVDIVQDFKRLVYEYYTRVVDESIEFTNRAGVADKEAKLIFNAFKDRYNQFAEKLRTFLKDLKEVGYDTGTGWAVASISKELETRAPA